MSSKTPEEGIKQFLALIESCNVFEKCNEILVIIAGPLAIARNKLDIVDKFKVNDTKLPLTNTNITDTYNKDLRRSILAIYFEELEKAFDILEIIDSKILELQAILDTIGQRLLVDIADKTVVKPQRNLIYGYFEDCRNIVLFLKLKSKILKNYLQIPADVQVAPNPFSKCPQFKSDEAKANILLLQLQTAICSLN